MHYPIKLIVKADNAEDALYAAERDAEELVERGHYDYYSLEGRWGKSEAVKVTSEEGKKLIKGGMEEDRADFDRAISAVRHMLDTYTDHEIYNEQFTKEDKANSPFYLSRYQFGILYNNNSGGGVFALDGDLWGSRVDNDNDLEQILSKDTDKLWVVVVDFHN